MKRECSCRKFGNRPGIVGGITEKEAKLSRKKFNKLLKIEPETQLLLGEIQLHRERTKNVNVGEY